MNYRHIYHAGNFADIFKHIILTRVIEYFKVKEQAFRVLDTHAAIGLYNLYSEQTQKTCEWHEGLQKFLSYNFTKKEKELIQPWLDAINYFNQNGKKIKYYPGSPLLTRFLLRKQDRLSATELHKTDYKILKSHFIDDYQSKIINLDGWLALKSQLPCKEKRTIVLVDPPFEDVNEFQKLVQGLKEAYKRSVTATYLLWYPIKNYNVLKNFYHDLIATNIKDILQCELYIKDFTKFNNATAKIKTPMAGCGVIVVNPPYVLKAELKLLKKCLIESLKQSLEAKIIIKQLSSER